MIKNIFLFVLFCILTGCGEANHDEGVAVSYAVINSMVEEGVCTSIIECRASERVFFAGGDRVTLIIYGVSDSVKAINVLRRGVEFSKKYPDIEFVFKVYNFEKNSKKNSLNLILEVF